jgi:AcrR family transcriptional regulator
MPHLIDVDSRTEDVRAAANRILATRGLGGLSLRAIAAEVRISLGSLTSHYDNRTRLMHLLVQLASRAWLEDIRYRMRGEGILAFLPADEDGVEDTRVWLSWCELGRSDPAIRGTVYDIRLDERVLLDRATREWFDEHDAKGAGLDDDGLDIAHAVVQGLRQAICSLGDPMPVERAREVLVEHVRRASGVELLAAEPPAEESWSAG